MPVLPLFFILAIALIVYMSLWFALGVIYLKRIDAVDVAWGLGFIYVAVITLLIVSNFEPIQLLAVALVCLWGLRLSLHIGSRNIKKTEDSRYKIFRDKWKSNFQVNVYLRIFLLQAALILAISTSSVGVITATQEPTVLTAAGFLVWVFGLGFEAISDRQLRNFLKKKNSGEIMKSGLWKYSRHPNYFGEITVWIGAGLVASSLGNYWGLIGPVVISILIVKISGIPPLEERYKDNPKYQQYKKRTSALVPLPPKSV